MSKCCICGREVTNENAPVLLMSAYGNPRLVCSVCEEHIETASNGREPNEIEAACRALGEDLTAYNNDESAIINAVGKIIADAKERCRAIKDGSYDFSKETEVSDEEEFDITEDLMETEEDRARDEEDRRVSDKLDKITSIISGIVFAGVAIYLLVRIIFF